MLPWNALPLNTIGIIVGISLLLSTIIAVFLIKVKRYEELGWILGVFLIILGSIAFLYLIPNEIVDNAVIPEDYFWEDEGNIQYWERNTVFFPEEFRFKLPTQIADLITWKEPIEETFIGKQVIHVTKFNKYENKAIIHDALYDENGEIFSVLNDLAEVSEWYEIDTHIKSLKYVNVEAGHMGIPSNFDDANIIRIGWVESNGKKDGAENVVLIREMKKIKTGFVDGLELAVWQSDISNTPITWHGEPYICDETLRLTVHPKTGYIVNVYRHLVLTAHLSQFMKIYYPDLLQSKVINRFLQSTDPLGEGAELIYETTEESQARHIAAAKSFDAQLTYYPIIIYVIMLIVGMALIWRYGGRGYYWKQYKDFEVYPSSKSKPKKGVDLSSHRNKKIKKVIAIIIGSILMISSITIVINGTVLNEDSDWYIFDDSKTKESPLIEETPPAPPGSNRAIDSGRHALEPTDEGQHKLARREWWYFNVFFNGPGSDLKNWSLIVSFNKMAPSDIRFLKRDNMFVILYDDKGASYNFNILDQRRRTLEMDGPGVDVKFKNNWAKGSYPSWQVHAESNEKNFIADLTYTADFMPVWIQGRSANLIIGKYLSGDYYVPRCNVEGTIKWNNKEFIVYGVGYHDHVWEGGIPRLVTKGWEWFNFHFDNGWEMYLSKFNLRWPRNGYAGALVISPNNRNIVEWDRFNLEYVELQHSQELPSMYYPLKYHLEASRDDMILKLDITVYNVKEIVFKKGRTGMFEGPCYVKGTFSWSGYTVELDGYGMSEVTRVEYFSDRLKAWLSNL